MTIDAHSGLFVTARVSATRLPGKMLTDIGGLPAIAHVLRRLDLIHANPVRVLCTTKAIEDDPLTDLAEKHGWQSFRGNEEDVLLRYLQASQAYDIDFFVNVDGDDLFCSTQHVDRMFEVFKSRRPDYLYCEGLPLGGAPTGVKVSALSDVCARKMEVTTQGWGKYFTQHGLYHAVALQAGPDLNRPKFRMTLDYEEDLAFFRTVVNMLGSDPKALTLQKVVALLDEHPEIAMLNQGANGKYWDRFRREHGAFDNSRFYHGNHPRDNGRDQ